MASPGHRLIIPGMLKIDAGYLSLLAWISAIDAIKSEDKKVAKYILPLKLRVSLYKIQPIPPFNPATSRAFFGIENTKPKPIDESVLIINSIAYLITLKTQTIQVALQPQVLKQLILKLQDLLQSFH